MQTFLKKIYHKHIRKTDIPSVQLRGRLTQKDQLFLDQKKGREYLSGRALAVHASKSTKPILFEIGFGNGSHIVSLAKENPQALVLGAEMYLAGVVNTLRLAEKERLTNLFVTDQDARQILKKIKKGALTSALVLFPDPWPKARHNKRRLLKAPFINTLLEKIMPGGQIILATDWADYADELEIVLNELAKEKGVRLSQVDGAQATNILQSTFAQRAQKEGRSVYLKKIIK